MKKTKKNKRVRVAEGVYSERGLLYFDLRIDGKLRWFKTGLTASRENIRKAVERRAELKYSEKERRINADISMKEYADIYLQRRSREISTNTYGKYFYRVKHIKDFFADCEVKKIKPKNVEAFLDQLFTKRNLTPETVREIRRHLLSIMDMAVDDMIIMVNPVKEVKIKKALADQYSVKKDQGETFFSYEEAMKFLEIIEGHRLKDFFTVMLYFGLRREEALGIRVNSLNFNKNTLVINHTVVNTLEGIKRQDTVKRGASEDVFPVPKAQQQIFRKLINEKKEYRKLFGSAYHESPYLFTRPDGSPYRPDNVTKPFKRIIKRHPELPQDITLEGLRTSCASILIHDGADPKSVQEWMRHKDIETTLGIYAKVKGMEEKTEVADRLNRIFNL